VREFEVDLVHRKWKGPKAKLLARKKRRDPKRIFFFPGRKKGEGLEGIKKRKDKYVYTLVLFDEP